MNNDNIITKIRDKDKLEIKATQEKKDEKTLLGRLSVLPGHKLFEINVDTQEVTEAEFNTMDVLDWNSAVGKTVKNKSVIKKDRCLYISALNKKNALKKLAKRIKEYQKLQDEEN